MSSAFMAASMAPAIFTNRPSSGSRMVLSRSLSVKNLRFDLGGGESVSIAVHCGRVFENLVHILWITLRFREIRKCMVTHSRCFGAVLGIDWFICKRE